MRICCSDGPTVGVVGGLCVGAVTARLLSPPAGFAARGLGIDAGGAESATGATGCAATARAGATPGGATTGTGTPGGTGMAGGCGAGPPDDPAGAGAEEPWFGGFGGFGDDGGT